MNLLLLFDQERTGSSDRFVVRGPRAHHVRTVLRKHAGDSLRVGLLDGPLGVAQILAMGAEQVELECQFEALPPEPSDVTLILAVPRPKVLRRVLSSVASMGVGHIVLLRTWRVERSYLDSPVLRDDAVQEALIDGLMQARTTRLPKATLELRFRPFIEDRAPKLLIGHRGFVLEPGARRSFAELDAGVRGPVAIAIGPEGGFVDFETLAFRKHGFEPVTLGAYALRVETACVAALAQLDLVRRAPIPQRTY